MTGEFGVKLIPNYANYYFFPVFCVVGVKQCAKRANTFREIFNRAARPDRFQLYGAI